MRKGFFTAQYLLVLLALFASPRLKAGLQVEKVGPRSAAEEAGMRSGDTISAWTSADASGNIASPFDFEVVKREYAPRGEVELIGQREGTTVRWKICCGRAAFTELEVAPIFPGQYAAEVAAARAYIQRLDIKKTTELSDLAEKIGKTDGLAGAWLYYEIGKVFYGNNQSKQGSSFARKAASLLDGLAKAYLLLDAASDAQVTEDLEDCSSFANEAREILGRLGPSSLLMARCLAQFGKIDLLKSRLAEASTQFTKALDLADGISANSFESAEACYGLGLVSLYTGEYDGGEAYLKRSRAIFEDNLSKRDVARVLSPLAVIALDQGDLQTARTYFNQALADTTDCPADRKLRAEVITNLGLVELNAGDMENAEEYMRQSLAMTGVLSASLRASALRSLADLYFRRGELTKAETKYKEALATLQKRPAGPLTAASTIDAANIFDGLGQIELERGNLPAAKARFLQEFSILEKIAPDGQEAAVALQNLAQIARMQRVFGLSEQHLLAALRIQQRATPQGADSADVYRELGMLSLDKGEPQAAENYFNQSLKLFERIAPGRGLEAEVLYELAKLEDRRGEASKAAGHFERSITALESQTTRLGGGEDAKAQYGATRASYYAEYIDFLLKNGEAERAFTVLERSRSRSFLRMLAERDLVFANEIPEELRKKQIKNAGEYEAALDQWSKLNSPESAQARSIEKQMGELEAEREDIQEAIKKQSPRLASLRYPVPLGPAEVAKNLDPGTVMLSYAVAADHTTLFVLPASGRLTTYRLRPGRTELRARIFALRRQIEEHATKEILCGNAGSLYNALLRPAEALLSQANRVVIVPDGPLHVLPFGALMRGDHFLVEWKPVHTVMSATVYAQVKAQRESYESLPQTLVAFGDPQLPAGPGGLKNADPVVRSRAARGLPLSPLPYSRTEIRGIAKSFPGQSLVFLGREATEERAKQVASAKYIHFATHGVIDERFPLASALVLSVPAKAQGADDGLLDAWEIIEGVRWKADLVVLSACQTALGKEVAGEGLIGLTRAIQFAGARSVVASLWRVDDRRTAEFMQRFYKHLNTLSKDEALRATQMDMIKSASAAPVYWAAFTLNGDWK